MRIVLGLPIPAQGIVLAGIRLAPADRRACSRYSRRSASIPEYPANENPLASNSAPKIGNVKRRIGDVLVRPHSSRSSAASSCRTSKSGKLKLQRPIQPVRPTDSPAKTSPDNSAGCRDRPHGALVKNKARPSPSSLRYGASGLPAICTASRFSLNDDQHVIGTSRGAPSLRQRPLRRRGDPPAIARTKNPRARSIRISSVSISPITDPIVYTNPPSRLSRSGIEMMRIRLRPFIPFPLRSVPSRLRGNREFQPRRRGRPKNFFPCIPSSTVLYVLVQYAHRLEYFPAGAESDLSADCRSGSPSRRHQAGRPRKAAAERAGLAERLLVNPNTVARAYGELAREGIIETPSPAGAVFIAALRERSLRAASGSAGCRRWSNRSSTKACRSASRRGNRQRILEPETRTEAQTTSAGKPHE